MSDTIIKVSNKTENFTVVTNEVARRNDLSARAKGVYFYLMTLPKDWKLFREELNTHFTEGKDALNTAFKELENAGYISKKRILDKTKFAGWEYSIYETATINGKSDSGNPKTDFPCTGNPQLLSTNSLLSTNQQSTDNKEDTPEIPAITSKPKRIKKEFIQPTIDEVTEYVLEKQLVIDPYKFIDWYTKTDWNDNQGKKITNWKNKAINWDSREKEKNPSAVPYSKPSYQETLGDFNVECCGQKISRYRPFCIKCGKQFNMDGTEK